MPHHKINYVELAAKDLSATKVFFETVFDWAFTDYGADYTAFSNAGLDGGFFRAEQRALTTEGSALVVLYSENLALTLEQVMTAGGVIVKPIFAFPGGSRFHFLEPSGNEFAVWSEK